jgi:2'-aminobiphenyl-2,3-diol 1,2-dioxygenase small subunit
MASYATSRLLQSLCRRPELAARLRTEPDTVFAEFGVPENERAALRAPSPEALGAVGVHPILQIHLMLALDPGFGARVNIGSYLDRLKGP